jgi:hypothetical protein
MDAPLVWSAPGAKRLTSSAPFSPPPPNQLSQHLAALEKPSHLIAAWWLAVLCMGVLTTMLSTEFLPAKFQYDAATIREYMQVRNLWDGLSFDGWVNTARAWDLVLTLLPEGVAIPAYYAVLALATLKLLDVFDVRQARYHLLAGGWVLCAALFLGQPSKEMVALPVALFLCLARGRAARLVATAVFLAYAAFFRPYWAICWFWFACVLWALRLHIAGRSRLSALLVLVGFVVPFAAAQVLQQPALTDARMMINAERVDSPDARSAFNNALENTGALTDMANAVSAWIYMNVPLAMLFDPTPHYVFFGVFQLCTLWFFVAGAHGYLRAARKIRQPGSTYLRCTAFVIAYSATQGLFEPDFGSFLRHEIILMVPLLIVIFFNAHAAGARHNPIRQAA